MNDREQLDAYKEELARIYFYEKGEGDLELVGITSKELIDSFNANLLENNGLSPQDAAKLTISTLIKKRKKLLTTVIYGLEILIERSN